MSAFGERIIFKQLLQRHDCIRIPMIQRDYAQGRPSQEEVREDFLKALETALRRPADDPLLPLNLDFVYGSIEGQQEKRFCPLDGQQRLTTLFLLHWYLAWNDLRLEDYRKMFWAGEHSRFSYRVRQSSNEFFDKLVVFEPECRPTDVGNLSSFITNQHWCFRSWRLDPTIQSALVMLDAIHRRFACANRLFERLTDERRPSITFQLLDLHDFGLSDDLYIKMNARGKPLTSFETFKARYGQVLGNQFGGESRRIDSQEFPIADFVARRMDTVWADLFWSHRDRETNLYDNAVMNVFRTVALVTRNPESNSYSENISILRNKSPAPSYSDFDARGWLDRSFTTTLVCLLETWSGESGVLATKLPNNRYFDESALFAKLVADADFSYAEVVQFAAYVNFLREHEKHLDPQEFQNWMRVVFNLSVNTSYDRPADLQRSILGLQKLNPFTDAILNLFGSSDKPTTGFSEQQIAEEKLKAELILRHNGWRPLIDRAEGHGYFRGQIEFLLEFSGVVAMRREKGNVNWDDDCHVSQQSRFQEYLRKAEAMFVDDGLAHVTEYRWQRALLSIGDYLLPGRRQSWSFLVNSSADPASWKRLLRGTGEKVPASRELLHRLWDRLAAERSFEEQLNEIIESAADLEPWREAFVRTPEAIEYCENQAIRWNSAEEVYLLTKFQMNGSHAELFTFCLNNTLWGELDQLQPLRLNPYQSVSGTDFEPHILITFEHGKRNTGFKVEFEKANFVISVERQAIESLPDILTGLCASGFKASEEFFAKRVSPADIVNALLELAQTLRHSNCDSGQAERVLADGTNRRPSADVG